MNKDWSASTNLAIGLNSPLLLAAAYGHDTVARILIGDPLLYFPPHPVQRRVPTQWSGILEIVTLSSWLLCKCFHEPHHIFEWFSFNLLIL